MSVGDHEPADRGGAAGWWERLRQGREVRRAPVRRTDRFVARPVTEQVSGRRSTYGRQAHRQGEVFPYLVALALMLGTMAAFAYVGVNWISSARTPSIAAGLSASPTPLVTAVAAPSPVASPSPTPGPRERSYVVQPGDSPAGIAEEFGITVEELMAVNEITDPRSLQIGQALTIPNAPPTRTPSQ